MFLIEKGGFGGLDIWFCIIDKDGNYGEALFGSRINTEYNEITPFLIFGLVSYFLGSDRNEKESALTFINQLVI